MFMKEVLKTSDFGIGLTELYIYESIQPSNRVILLLKGIYGYHFELTDFGTDLLKLKWDQAFIKYFIEYANVVCINTSRLPGYDQTSFSNRKDSFSGKVYLQEIEDVVVAFNRGLELLASKGINDPKIHLVGKSFGGTTFLGMNDILQKTCSVSMLGSGCGRSNATVKPLLSSLPQEEELLKTIRDYLGVFMYCRGELDEIVPIESQEKIVKSSGAKLTSYITMKGVDHQFEKMDGKDSLEPWVLLRKMLLNSIFLSEGVEAEKSL